MGTLIWLFGVGASIACGLVVDGSGSLGEPPAGGTWRISGKPLCAEINAQAVDTSPYPELLTVLGSRTASGWRHRFVTTNWDGLLEREVNKAYPEVCPPCSSPVTCFTSTAP